MPFFNREQLVLHTINGNIEHGGDLLITGDVLPGTIIHVRNGSLIIKGKIGFGSSLRLELTADAPQIAKPPITTHFSMHTLAADAVSSAVLNRLDGISVIGQPDPLILTRVKPVARRTYTLQVQQDISERVSLESDSSILCANVAGYCVLRALDKICVGNVGSHTQIRTIRGDIKTLDLADEVKLISEDGTITLRDYVVGPCEISTKEGDIIIDGKYKNFYSADKIQTIWGNVVKDPSKQVNDYVYKVELKQ